MKRDVERDYEGLICTAHSHKTGNEIEKPKSWFYASITYWLPFSYYGDTRSFPTFWKLSLYIFFSHGNANVHVDEVYNIYLELQKHFAKLVNQP